MCYTCLFSLLLTPLDCLLNAWYRAGAQNIFIEKHC